MLVLKTFLKSYSQSFNRLFYWKNVRKWPFKYSKQYNWHYIAKQYKINIKLRIKSREESNQKVSTDSQPFTLAATGANGKV